MDEQHRRAQEHLPPTIDLGLAPGSSVSHYRIVEPLGRGGMGEVWLADDLSLNRRVALKFPAPAVLDDPTSRGRLLREARAAASLRHPAVCRVFELGQVDGHDFIAMEHLAGETLATRLARGPIPVKQALAWAAAIAGALEEAHDHGIVHRDLKPGNIIVTPESEVKVLDFGLARALPSRGDTSPEAATWTAGLTAPGTIYGTLGYMAPEQLRGEPATERADLWALGCVIYEMLTAERAFPGSSFAEAAAATLGLEPDWSALPVDTPLELRRLVSRCLRKDPARRLRHAGDARLVLEEGLADEPPPGLPPVSTSSQPVWRRHAGWAVAALLLALVGVGWWLDRSVGSHLHRPMRFLLSLPDDMRLSSWVEEHSLALSPDGGNLAFVAVGGIGSGTTLFVRALDEVQPVPVEGSSEAGSPFWSPDGQWLAFFARGRLWKVPATGGTPSDICEVAGANTGAWGAKGTIVFTQSHHEASGVYAVPASGGQPRRLYTGEDVGELEGWTILRWPAFVGDGHEFFLHVSAGTGSYVVRGSLDGAPLVAIPGLESSSRVVWVPPGVLVWSRDGTLFAQRCDARGVPYGEAVPITDQVRGFITGWSSFAVGGPAALAVQRGTARGRLAWRDRAGRQVGVLGDVGGFPAGGAFGFMSSVLLSADGRRAVLGHLDPWTGTNDLWVWDTSRALATRLTSEPTNELGPVWTADEGGVFYTPRGPDAPADLVERRLTGGERELLPFTEGLKAPVGRHPDGRPILAWQHPGGSWQLFVVSSDGEREPLLDHAVGSTTDVAFSPEGRQLALVDFESGRAEVYLAPADGGVRQRVSSTGGTGPRWRRDGRELYYLSRGLLMAVSVDASGTVGPEEELFPLVGEFDVAPDGRFLVIEPEGETSPPVTLMLDWLPLQLWD